MTIDEIYDDLDLICDKLHAKSKRARHTAQKARKSGNIKKWDKFNAVSRAYEMTYTDLVTLKNELTEHLSMEKRQSFIPF